MPKPRTSTVGRRQLVFAMAIAIIGPGLALLVIVATVFLNRAQGHWPAVNRGRAFLQQGRPDLAFQAVQEIRDEAPGAGEAMTVAGLALVQLKELKTARMALERAIRLQPKQLDATKALAGLYLMVGASERGAQLLESAARLDPNDARLWVGIGNVYDDIGEPERASTAYQEALRLDSRDRETRLRLIGDLLDSNQPGRAAPFLDEALKEKPDDPQLLSHAARRAHEMGDENEANALAERALARDPDDIVALLIRARAYVTAGKDKSALADLEHAVDISPNDLEALQSLAQVESRLGLKERAARTIERHRRETDRIELMVQLTSEMVEHPDDPELRCRMAEAAAEGGKTLLASQSFQAALVLDPKNRRAQAGLASLQGADLKASPLRQQRRAPKALSPNAAPASKKSPAPH